MTRLRWQQRFDACKDRSFEVGHCGGWGNPFEFVAATTSRPLQGSQPDWIILQPTWRLPRERVLGQRHLALHELATKGQRQQQAKALG